MKSYPSFEEVLDEIGEKPVEAFARSVRLARRDLGSYRDFSPQWVADHSERGLANWISDRLWAHLAELAEPVSDMTVFEKGPLRELIVGLNHRFRFKRHDDAGSVASFPTAGFLEFATQPSAQLPGLEETRLIAGYDWNKDSRDMGAAVMSLRDGKDNVIWKEPLPDVGGQAGEEGTGPVPVLSPTRSGPSAPTVAVSKEVGQKARGTSEDE